MCSTGFAYDGLHLTDELAFVGVAAEQDTGHSEVGHSLQYGVVCGTGGTTGSSSDDDVEADVSGLRKELREWRGWVALLCGDEVVVVGSAWVYRRALLGRNGLVASL